MESIPYECHVRIYDMCGKLVHKTKLFESESVLNLVKGYGIYFIEIDNSHIVQRNRISIAN